MPQGGESPVAADDAPNTPGVKVEYHRAYDNFIGGKFVPPTQGQYFDVVSPIDGKAYTRAARSTAEDVELSLDAAHAAAPKWAATAPAERANLLLKTADRLEANLEKLAYAETVDNGKPMRETLKADIPLTIDHFRYFAGCVRAQEGALSEIDGNTIAYHFQEPLGVVGQIISWNFPILMAARPACRWPRVSASPRSPSPAAPPPARSSPRPPPPT